MRGATYLWTYTQNFEYLEELLLSATECTCGGGSVRETEMHIAEPFVPQPSASEPEVATGKLERYKFPGVNQIPAELIQAGG
jgi:hypothetical protein